MEMEEAKTISVEDVIALVDYIARSLVDEPDAVKVEVKSAEMPTAANDGEAGDGADEAAKAQGEIEPGGESAMNTVTLELTVAPDDTGKVIGKQGRIAKAIRTVVRAATVKGDIKYRVDIM